MTIDEAIKHCEDIAKSQDMCAEISVSEHAKERISKCATDHKQLAEWLRDLKEAKRLLKKAVSGFRYLGSEWMEHEDRCTLDCSVCPLHNSYNCSHWNMQDEALKLIGKDGEY